MGLHVVDAACEFAPDRSHAKIVIESDIVQPSFAEAIEELGSTEARNLALGHAATHGVPDPRINGQSSGAYPINKDGLSLEQVRGPQGESLPQQHPAMQPARYRNDIPVCRKLI